MYNNHTSLVSYNMAHIKRTSGFGLRLKVVDFWILYVFIWQTNEQPNCDNFICKTHNILLGWFLPKNINDLHKTFFLFFSFSIFFFLFLSFFSLFKACHSRSVSNNLH
ncbi:hypothetical protein Hanom_Chr05g00446431 [Helianthus anomalus]